MPVTIRTQPIDGDPWLKSTTTDAHKILRTKIPPNVLSKNGLMQSSFQLPDKFPSSSTSPSTHPNSTRHGITPCINGLVYSAVEAWNNHHHLVLRPDDIWLAILSQLGFFINAHAEKFREFFVSHEGKKTLEVKQYTHPDAADYATFAKDMTEEIAKNINDPALVPWVLPNFSTTTENDRVVGSVLLMGAMQRYFNYDFVCERCGIPSITLLGTREDWVELAQRIDKIKDFPHDEAVEFHGLMEPLAKNFIKTFDEPFSTGVLAFWRIIASRETPRYGMSGGPRELLTGWISAFCFWTEDGLKNSFLRDDNALVQVDGLKYLAIVPKDVVTGWASVPVNVKWYDNGVLIEDRKCKMTAGSVGMRPGKHADLGVRIEGLPLPEREGGGEKEVPKKVNQWRVEEYGAPESPADRMKRRLKSGDKRQEGAPAVELGFDAVTPVVGWWVYQVGEEEGEKKDRNEYEDDSDWEKFEALFKKRRKIIGEESVGFEERDKDNCREAVAESGK